MPDMMTTLKVKLLAKKGINVNDHTSLEWLTLAENAERTLLQIGPFDGAYEYFAHQRSLYLDAACVAETLEGN